MPAREPSPHRLGVRGRWPLPFIAVLLVPKCGLCATAWLLGLVGLSLEICGGPPTWGILAREASRHLGLPLWGLAAVAALPAAVATIAVWRRGTLREAG